MSQDQTPKPSPNPIDRAANGCMKLFVIAICVTIALFCLFMFASQKSFEALIPPLYPGSIHDKRYFSAGSGGYAEANSYTTDASAEELVAYFQKHMPDAVYSENQHSYDLRICDSSVFGKFAALLGEDEWPSDPQSGALPCVTVQIQRDLPASYKLGIWQPAG